jgi:hypothetical protein
MTSKHNPQIPNPFDKAEVLQPWLSQDKNFQSSQKLFWQNYKSSFNSRAQNTNLFNYMTQFTLKFISAHVAISVLTGILIFSAIGASAAEVLAPEKNKPSTVLQNLLNINKQPDKDPYTPLRPDAQNDVVKIEDCDLSLKYPKQINNIQIVPTKLDPKIFEDKSIRGATLGSLSDLTKSAQNQPNLNTVQIQCSNEFMNYYADENTAKSITNEELANYTGWFISTESKLENLRISKSFYNHSITFKFKNKYYYIQSFDKTKLLEPTKELLADPAYSYDFGEYQKEIEQSKQRPGINSNQIQIQFNSVTKNESNANLADKSTQDIYKSAISKDPTNTKPSELKLQSETNLNKTINNNELWKNTPYADKLFCGIPNLVKYQNANGKNEAKFTNKNQYSTNNISYYNRITEFLNNPKDTYTQSLLPAFAENCANNMYSNYITEIKGVKYPGVDKYRVFILSEGYGTLAKPNIVVYAQKGDDIIRLSQEIQITDEENIYNQYENNCSNTNSGAGFKTISEMVDCGQTALSKYFQSLLDDGKTREAGVTAQELTNTYALKTN